ncbi:MAG: cytochrome c, partial [Gemmatimonadota bacterium]|nr:cytochrome c [Gemmatimonadota bacterium]
GESSFERWCVSCHGPRGAGSAVGPPLVHRVYRPAHHGDAAFRLAVTRGVRAHHWTYGDMPPVPEVASDEADAIVDYLRWLQRQVGIE